MKILKPWLLSFLTHPQHPSYAFTGWHLRWRWGLFRAYYLYRPWHFLLYKLKLGPKITWGHRVSFLSSVRFKGPGHIHLGSDCIFDSQPDLYTHDTKAEIHIGPKVFINGTRMGCQNKIEIQELCILADARLMDTDFHSLAWDRYLPNSQILTSPILIQKGAWLAAGSALLKGVTVGEYSIIAFGSVVTHSIESYSIAAGNPAKIIGQVPN